MSKSITFSLFLMSSLIMLVPFANTNLFSNVMAQGYNTYNNNYYGDSSSYSKYQTDDKKYECRTGPFEGCFVGPVEFCKFKFDDDRKDNRDNKTEIQGPPTPVGATGQQGIQGPPSPQGETGLQKLNRINSTSVYFSGCESSSNTSNSGVASSVAM